MLNTRNRIINFRVTEEEFARLQNAAVEDSARCLSDYARSALLRAMAARDDDPKRPAEGKVGLLALGQRLARVELTVAKLESMMSIFASDKPRDVSVEATA